MGEGYIYILVNRSYIGLIKIGSTTFGATLRAKQLSSNTAVPTPFTVAYEAYVNHYEEFEKAIHNRLSQFRVNSKREFFKVQLDFAIELISIMKENPYYRPTDHYESIEILPQLINKYGDNIDHQIVSARIYQEIDRVYLETTKYEYIGDYLKDQYIHREDLGFIIEDCDENDLLFKATDPIEMNAKKFMELDDISMANCVSQLFISSWNPYHSTANSSLHNPE